MKRSIHFAIGLVAAALALLACALPATAQAQDITLTWTKIDPGNNAWLAWEGRSQDYTVKLTSLPSADVTVTISEGSPCPHSGAWTIDTDLVTGGDQNTLTFTTSNWSTAQTVRLTAPTDSDEDDALCAIQHSGSGGGYDNVSKTNVLIVEEFDGSVHGSFLAQTINGPEGRKGEYTVYLTEEPTGDVTVTITYKSGDTDISVDTDLDAPGNQNTLTITTTNYANQAIHKVTIRSAEDGDTERGKAVFTHTATGGGYTESNGTRVIDATLWEVDDDDPPSSPTDLSATAGNASAALSWKAALGAESLTYSKWQYRYKTTGGYGSWTDMTGSDKDTTSYTVTGLTNGTLHTFEVRAYNDVAGEASDEVTVTPKKPLSFGSATIGDHTFARNYAISTITLPAATGGDPGYTYSLSPAPPAGLSFNASSRQLTGTPTTLTAADTHTYTVTDTASATASLSFSMSVVTPQTVPKMGAPTLTGGERQISLSWSHPQGVSGLQAYRIRYREKGQSGWTYADARPDSGEQNFEAHVTSATIPANEAFTMKDDTTYEVEIRAGRWGGGYTGWGAWSDVAEAATLDPTLTAGSISNTSATLTIGNWSGNWYYKETAPSTNASCSTEQTSATANLTGLTASTTYTYKAYSDSNCTAEIASETFSTLATQTVPKMGTPALTGGDKQISLRWSHPDGVSDLQAYRIRYREKGQSGWTYADARPDSGEQNFEGQVTSATIPAHETFTMKEGAIYQVQIRAGKWNGSYGGWGAWSDTAEVTTNPRLIFWNLGWNSVELKLENYTGTWYYQLTGGNCSGAQTATSAEVGGLQQGTPYEARAYSESGCASASLFASASFTTRPPKVAGVQVTPRDQALAVSWTAQNHIAYYKLQWKSGNEDWSTDRQQDVSSGSSTTIDNLVNGTTYSVRVAAFTSGGGYWSDVATGTPKALALTFSNATAASVRLNLAKYTGTWHYKYTSPAGGQCSAAIDTGTSEDSFADATGLDAGTTYTFAVYADSACSTAMTTGSVITVPPKVAGVQATAATASLALSWTAAAGASDYVVQWKSGNQGWDSESRQQIATGNSTAISPLFNGTAYSVRVAARNTSGWGAWSDTATGTPSGPTLAASNIQAATATLTISGHSTAWHYKYTSPSGGQCSAQVAAGTSAANLSNLTQGTTYAFAAYSDSGCATPLALAPAFLTKPGQVTGVAVEALSGKLKVTWSEVERADSYKVQWKSGNQNYDSSREAPSTGGTTNEHTISSLTNNTTYTVRVAAKNAAGYGAWSVEVTGMPTGVTLSAGSVGTKTATLTIANHTGNWHYKHTSPAGGQCSAAQTGASASLANLKPNTSHTFAAYSDSNCSTLLAVAAAFTTRAAKVTGVLVNALNTGLKVSWNALEGAASYKVQWKSGHQNYGSSRQATATGTQHSITGLDNNTTYTVRVAGVVDGLDSAWSDDATGAPNSVYLSAGTVTRTTATLTLGGHSGNWWYTKSGGTTPPCINTGISGNTLSLTNLSASAEYTIRAFSNSNCAPPTSAYLTAVTFRTAAGVTLAASSVEATTATLTIANHTGNWHYKANAAPDASCSSSAVTGTTKNLASLSSNTSYTYKAYSDSSCSTTALATAPSFLTKPGKPTAPAGATSVGSGKLTITASVTGSGTLSKWQYQQKSALDTGFGSWKDISSTSTSLSHTVSGLTNGTDYQFKVRAVNATGDGAASDASTAARPVAVTLDVASRSSTTATLTLGGFAGNWWWTRDTESDCSNTGISGNTLSLTDLAKNTSYTIHAWPDNSCGPTSIRLTQRTFTTLATDATLAASSVEATTATLTIGNYSGAWHYKYTAPSGGQCSSAVSATSANVTGLATNTNHTFKAYNDSNCSTALATETLLTKPGKPATPAASSGGGSGKLTVTASVTGDGTLSNWQYQQKEGSNNYGSWTDISSTSTSLSHTVSGLTDGTNYQYKVRAVNTTGNGAASDASTAAAPAAPTLAGSSVEATTATLAISNWTGDWYYKYTSPSGGDCSASAVSTTTTNLTGLSSNTSYTFKAYSDSGCSTTALATASSFLTKPGKPTTPAAATNVGSGKLTITASVTGSGTLSNWQYQQKEGSNNFGSWTNISSTSTSLSHTVSGLTDGTDYQYKVRAVNATGDGAASDASTAAQPTAPTLAGSSVEAATATLTIGNWTGSWYYKYTAPSGGDCSASAVSATTKDLTGLSTNTDYTYKAYSDSGCSTLLATAPSFLTKPGKPTKPVAAPGGGSGKLTITASVTGSGTLSNWQYQQKDGGNFGSWTDISSTSTSLSHTVSGLTNGTDYQFKVRAVNATGAGAASDASDAAQPRDETLTVSNVEATTATLAIGNHPANWYYKANAAPHASCSSAVSTTSVDLTGLSTNTNYTYKAYSDSGCTTELVTATLLTKPGKPTKPVAAVGAGSGKLTITASVTGDGTLSNWQYQQKEGSGNYGSWTNISSTSTSLSHTVSGLTDGTNYQFKVRAVNATGDGAASDASTAAQPAAATLAGSSVEATTATLTIGNWTGDWYFQYTSPSGGDCSASAVSKTTKDIADLSSNTNYTFKAYSDSGCSTLLATASSFLTKPGKPTKPSAGSGAGSGKLTFKTSVTGDGTLRKWQYQQKKGNGNFGSWIDISSTSTTLFHTVSELTDRADYQFKVRAVNATGTGAASDASDAVQPRALTLAASSVEATTATLVLGNWTSNWYYKYTAPSGGTCSTNAVSGTTEDLTGLATNTNYTFKAYSDSGCSTTALVTAPSFLTKPGKPTKPVAAVGAGSGKLTITASVTGDGTPSKWQYQQKEGSGNYGSWTNISSTSTSLSHTVSGLTNRTDYRFKVRAVNETGDGETSDASDAAQPRNETLTASNVEATSATLTIGNWTGTWYYQYTTPAGGSCSSAVSSSATTVTGLATGTTHTFKAYSDSSCSTAIATAADFLTKPGKVANLQVASASGALNLSWSGQTGAASYKVQWRSGQENWDETDRQTTLTETSVTISPLVNGTRYDLRVAAVNKTGDGKWSDVVSLAPGETGSLGGGGGDTAPVFGSQTIPDQTWRHGVEIEPLVLPAAEGAPLMYTFTPRLPTGISFDPATRTLSGAPTSALSATAYTYTATYANGDTHSLTFRITVAADSEPSFATGVTISDQTWRQGVEIEPLVLPAAEGAPLMYTFTPRLPTGISFDPATRTLSGAPTSALSATAYTYTATYANGDTHSLTFRITVAADSEPSFATGVTISDQTWRQGVEIEPLVLPAAEGAPLMYTFTPRLPTGISFDPATRTLSGAPTSALSATAYTYTATYANGDTHSLTFRITVAADSEPSFATGVAIEDQVYTQNAVIEPYELPAASGGDGTLSYALEPPLPAGLDFNAATRTLSGLPTQATRPRTYEYTATDADGDRASLTFTITVKVAAAEKKRFNDGLAAQGRALLSGATSVIGERFRNPGASSWSGATECAGAPPESAEPRDTASRGLGTGQDSTGLGEEPRDAASRGLGTGRDSTGPGEDSPPEDCTTGLLNTVAQAVLGMMGGGAPGQDSLDLADADETRPRGPRASDVGTQPQWNWKSLVWGRSFALPLQKPGTSGSTWTLWGAGDIQGFQGAPGSGRYDGQVRSLYLGVDAQWQAQWLAGAALAQSWGETDYVAEPGGSAGQLETTLTSIYPYVRGTLGAGLEVWAIGGYGRGEAEQMQAGATGAVDTRDLTMAMGATGVRQPMTEVGGAQVALVGGAGYLSLATEDGTSAIADLDVAVNRARLAVEATWTAGGLAPYFQVGGRYDGGAGQTGAGLETVAGLRYTSERLEFEARGRWLAAHAADGYAEYGGLARLAVKPLADGTGFQLNVSPRWGAADGGAGVLGGGAALLDGGAMPGLGVSGVPQATNRALMLESELGYGFAVFERQGVLTPYGGFALTGDETRQYRLGARLGMAQWLNLSLEGTRREATGPQPADQGVQLQLEGRF